MVSRIAMVCPKCNTLLQMVEGTTLLSPQSATGPSTPQKDTRYPVAELIIPSSNVVDIQAVRQFISSLPTPVSLEFLAESGSIRMLLRGPEHALQFMSGSIPSIWPRAALRYLTPEESALPEESQHAHSIWYTLSRPAYLPLLILTSFTKGDPMNLLLGSLRGLMEGEGAWLQIYMPETGKPKWLEDIRRRLKMEQQRGAIVEPANPSGSPMLMPQTATTGGAVVSQNILWLLIFFFAIPGLVGLIAGGWWMLLGAIYLLLLILVGGWAMKRLSGLTSDWMQTSLPEVIQKVSQNPFYPVSIRLSVWAPSATQSSNILNRINHSFRQFGSEQGNNLIPCMDTAASPFPVWPGDLNSKQFPSMWLGATELSALWHPPLIGEGTAPSLMTTNQVEKRTPPRRDVKGLSPIGTSVSEEGTPVTIDLTFPALISGMYLHGKSRMGKSTLMEHICRGALSLPRSVRPAVLYFDPHGDSAPRIPGFIPPECVSDVIYYDVMDPSYTIGTNPLDVHVPGNTVERAVQNVIDTGKAIWDKYWGPRMFVPLEATLRAFAAANMFRDRNNQLGLSAVVPFLMAKPEFRRAFLEEELKANNSPYYDELARYFYGEYENIRDNLRQEIIAPVTSKGNRFARSPAIWMFSYPHNMLPLQSILQERKIVIISTHLHDVGVDLGGFYGSFLLNMFSREMGLQGRLPIEQRIPLLFIADECHTFTGYNWTNHMSQLTKFGFWNVLGAQTFATLRESTGENNNNLAEILLGGVQSLAVFQVNGADAKYLSENELSSNVGGPKQDTLINLDNYQFWYKTLSPNGNRLHPFDVDLLPPLPVDESQQQAVMEGRSRYSVPIEEAKRDSERVLNDFLGKYGGPSMISAGATGLPSDAMIERTPSGTQKPRKRKPDDMDNQAARALSGEGIKTGPPTVLPAWNQLPSQNKQLSDTETEALLSGLIDVSNSDELDSSESEK